MNTIIKVLKIILIYYVSLVLFSFAISKFFNTQFQIWSFAEYVPLKDLSLFWHAWSFFGRSYNYNLFIGLTEFFAAALLLYNRTRLMGLLIATVIYINVIIIDIEFEVKNATLGALIQFVIILLLLIPYSGHLKKFFWDMAGQFNEQSKKASRLNLIVPTCFILGICMVVVVFSYRIEPSKDGIIGAYKIEAIKINSDTVFVTQGQFTREPMLFFEFNDVCILSLNDSTYYGVYSLVDGRLSISMDWETQIFKRVKGELLDGNLIVGSVDNNKKIEIKIDRADKH